jgi:hypothetical protein
MAEFDHMLRRACDAAYKNGVTRTHIVKALTDAAARWSTEPATTPGDAA